VASDMQFWPRIMHATFSATNTDVLLVQKGGNVMGSRLMWFDRAGKELGAVGDEAVYANPTVQANGKAVAYDVTDAGSMNTDVWTNDPQGKAAKRLTFDPALDATPVWSPDGTQVVFTSSRGTAFDLYLKEANGAQEEKVIFASDADKYPNSWSRDGKYILFTEGPDLKYLTMPEMKSTMFMKAPATIRNGAFSPDGKFVAYASNDSGSWEVYVTSFPEAHGRWQVSNAGGEQPKWRGDGKELFYLGEDGKLMAAPVKTGAGFDIGKPVVLFQTNPKETAATSEQFTYDVTPDGQRILVNTIVTGEKVQPMTVVLHWGEK
jgi:eukaryotic-like serine/threonine-protein kinase